MLCNSQLEMRHHQCFSSAQFQADPAVCSSSATNAVHHHHHLSCKLGAGDGLLSEGPHAASPAVLAAQLYTAFAAEEADEALRTQAVRCLVFLAARLEYGGQSTDSSLPSIAGKTEQEELTEEEGSGSESKEEDLATQQSGGSAGLTLHGLVRRIARLAGNRMAAAAVLRATALRCMAALASRLAGPQLQACLPLLLPPLYRIEEAASSEPAEVGTSTCNASRRGHFNQPQVKF